jgi:hypothetical protein
MLRNPGFKITSYGLVQARVKPTTRSPQGKRLQTALDSGCLVSTAAEVQWMETFLPINYTKASFNMQQDVLASYTLAVAEQQAVAKQAGPLSADKILHPKQRKHLSIYAKNRQQNIAFQAAYQSSQEDKGAQALRDPGEGLHKVIYSHSLQNPSSSSFNLIVH